MECGQVEFHSETANWRAVSMATKYRRVVVAPDLVETTRGTGVKADLNGAVVERITPRIVAQRRLLNPEEAKALAAVTGSLGLWDTATENWARGPDGNAITLPEPSSTPPAGDKVFPGTSSEVSWRTSSGVYLDVPGGPEEFLAALQNAFPEVNTIRLDFNAYTLANPATLAGWRRFANDAASAGYQLIIQNSDGDLAGGATGQPHLGIGPANALSNTSELWQIQKIRDHWRMMLDWFRAPDNAAILDAVLGWELINEPMKYGRNTRRTGAIYSRQMSDLIEALDWENKRLFIGGLGASAQFEHIDLDLLRKAAGPNLVWSAHMYPTWVTARYPDPENTTFFNEVCQRIGPLAGSGDDIMVTETQLYTENGSLSPTTSGKRAGSSYNMARLLPWFADNGIGVGWWPPTGRASHLMSWEGRKTGYATALSSAAFAHWGWSRAIKSPPLGGTEHWGDAGGDLITVAPFEQPDRDNIVSGVSNPHGLIAGLGGDDILLGAHTPDLLYGGEGTDHLSGGDGDDWLFGGRGGDVLLGGAGADVLIDPEGANRLDGGPGDDHVEGTGSLNGGAGDDHLIARIGDVTMTGGAGLDTYFPGPKGQITITDFERGFDTLDLSLISVPKRRPTVVLTSQDRDAVISYGDLSVRLRGAANLALTDIMHAGPRRVIDQR